MAEDSKHYRSYDHAVFLLCVSFAVNDTHVRREKKLDLMENVISAALSLTKTLMAWHALSIFDFYYSA